MIRDEVFDEIKLAFIEAAASAGIEINTHEIKTDFIRLPSHKPPSSFPKDKLAVYVFMFGSTCLKVGKAGSKSAARYCSQHYGINAPSTLATSLIKNQEKLNVSGIDAANVKDWICKNTYRVNFLIPSTMGPFVLSLLEAFVQCCLQPEFEGFSSQKIKPNPSFKRDWLKPAP